MSSYGEVREVKFAHSKFCRDIFVVSFPNHGQIARSSSSGHRRLVYAHYCQLLVASSRAPCLLKVATNVHDVYRCAPLFGKGEFFFYGFVFRYLIGYGPQRSRFNTLGLCAKMLLRWKKTS